ncbi:propionyl-CoA synthetase [Roseiarcus sp.]|uniref:propionyl-CoA synthetase n=1 Tax=Roseiarcus sp. TaxID=1969460 RepID=UPI003F9A6329
MAPTSNDLGAKGAKRMSGYRQTYDQWLADPQAFWAEAAREISWIKAPERIFDPEAGVYGRWFPDARVNACYNAIDRHVEGGRGDQAAIYYDSPVTGTKRTVSYRELLGETAALAAVLQDLGVAAGDRVLIYMPMIPEALVAMFACARIGAVHSVVFGGFAAKEVATRIDDAEPKVILTASCGIEPGRIVEYKPLLDLAIGLSKAKTQSVVVFQRPQIEARMNPERDHDWKGLVEAAKAAGKRAACADLAATDPLYILYTSGTTGVPKGVVRDIGGYIVALKWTMSALYDVKPGETYWSASDIGWVVGHSYIVYAPLLHGCTTVLYEGKPIGTPDAGAFWRVIEEYKVRAFFTAPTAFRAVRKEDPQAALLKKYDITSMHTLFLAGERADPDTVEWAEKVLGVPVVDHWWQTETGWAIAANPVGLGILPIKPGSPTVPMPGYAVEIVDEACHPVPVGKMGSIVIKLPLPPGCLPTLYRQDERMRESYLKEFPGYYKTADAGTIDEDGYLTILGRTDDIINVAGHRLSTGGMEEVVAAHPDVAECAVLGIKDEIKGEQPCGFIVLKAGVTRPNEEIEKEVVKLVRDKIGPVAAFKIALVVSRLPKTRSGKILRGTMKKIADHETWATPATIEDPKVLDEIKEALEAHAQ